MNINLKKNNNILNLSNKPFTCSSSHYNTNRAPLGLHFGASWLKSKKEFREELVKFIDEMLGKNDVFFVNMLQVIQWMQNPTEVNALRDFQDWKGNRFRDLFMPSFSMRFSTICEFSFLPFR